MYRVSLGKKQRSAAHGAHEIVDLVVDRVKRRSRKPNRATPVPGDLRERIIRRAKLLGAIWAVLLAVDLATGARFWAHWPGIAMAALVALQATPLFVHGWFKLQYARGIVIVGALALINLFTWSGYPWVMWPAGALIAFELIRRLGTRSG